MRTKFSKPEVFDIFFAFETESFLDLHLDPEPLAVEAVLVAGFAPAHRPEAVVKVFVGAPPSVMDSHRVVGSDRSIDERPVRIVLMDFIEFLK